MSTLFQIWSTLFILKANFLSPTSPHVRHYFYNYNM